jgi:hypothetical protein
MGGEADRRGRGPRGHARRVSGAGRAPSRKALVRWLAGLFDAARDAARHGHATSEAVDRLTALVLHERGTLELVAGNRSAAKGDLCRAMRLRRRLGDPIGAAASRQNLALFASACGLDARTSRPGRRSGRPGPYRRGERGGRSEAARTPAGESGSGDRADVAVAPSLPHRPARRTRVLVPRPERRDVVRRSRRWAPGRAERPASDGARWRPHATRPGVRHARLRAAADVEVSRRTQARRCTADQHRDAARGRDLGAEPIRCDRLSLRRCDHRSLRGARRQPPAGGRGPAPRRVHRGHTVGIDDFPSGVVSTSTPQLEGDVGVASGDLYAVTVQIYSGREATGALVQSPDATIDSGRWPATPTSLQDGTYTVRSSSSTTPATSAATSRPSATRRCSRPPTCAAIGRSAALSAGAAGPPRRSRRSPRWAR